MAHTVTLHFPFRLNGREHKAEIQTGMVRKENIVTFVIPFNALVSVNSEKPYSVYYSAVVKPSTYAISIDFKSINDAISFYNTPEVHLSYKEVSEVESLDKKLEEVSSLLETTGSSWRKRKKHTELDEDGFTTV